MNKVTEIEISIPADEDGYVLLECPSCGEMFMLTCNQIEDEALLEIWCPGCGLAHDSYWSGSVINNVNKLAKNYTVDLVNDFVNDLEKVFKGNKMIKFQKGSKLKKEGIDPLVPEIGDFIEREHLCCKQTAKIETIRNFSGGYCPFCGGNVDGN